MLSSGRSGFGEPGSKSRSVAQVSKTAAMEDQQKVHAYIEHQRKPQKSGSKRAGTKTDNVERITDGFDTNCT
jgi:hypothetical protein